MCSQNICPDMSEASYFYTRDSNNSSEHSVFPPQSGQGPPQSLATTLETLFPDGRPLRSFFIEQEDIRRRVSGLLEHPGRCDLWQIAHSLRILRCEYLASPSSLLKDVDLMLDHLDGLIHSEAKDILAPRFTTRDSQNTSDLTRRRAFYSIIMLSYGAAANISKNGISHAARLEHVWILPPEGVILNFKYENESSSCHEISVLDLPRLGEYGIELDLGPFSTLLPRFDTQNRHNFHNQSPLPIREHKILDQRPANMRYGCTFSGCYEKFGSKFDWKRHEISYHFQQECWKCAFCPSSIIYQDHRASRCESEDASRQDQTQLFYNSDAFIMHLRSIHSVDDDTISLLKREQRIGRNCQSRFWCGFCGEIVVLQTKGLEGANERFDHIDRHFHRGEAIEAWSEMDGSGVKGEERSGDENESKGYHTSTASPEVQPRATSCVLHVQDEKGVVGADDWDSDFSLTPILERSPSRSTNFTAAI
jgi:hypothetical protein